MDTLMKHDSTNFTSSHDHNRTFTEKVEGTVVPKESESGNVEIINLYICAFCQLYLSLNDSNNNPNNHHHHATEMEQSDDIAIDMNGGTIRLKLRSTVTSGSETCCFVCLDLWRENEHEDVENMYIVDGKHNETSNRSNNDTTFSLFQHLINSVREASKPYCCDIDNNYEYKNRYSRHKAIPTVVLPGDIIYRFVLIHEILKLQQQQQQQQQQSSSIKSTTTSMSTNLSQLLSEYILEWKQYIKRTVQACCNALEYEQMASNIANTISATAAVSATTTTITTMDTTTTTTTTTTTDDYYNTEYPSCIPNEELGYLTFHTIVIPTLHHHRPIDVIRQINANSSHHLHRNKRTRKERMMQQNIRYTVDDNDNDDNSPKDVINDNNLQQHTPPYMEQSQGGDPRVNFERRFVTQQQHGTNSDASILWSIQHAMDQLVAIQTYINTMIQRERNATTTTTNNSNNNHQLYEHLKYMSLPSNNDPKGTGPIFPLSCYTTVWRRPFYIRGIYTKMYRTISQTPFFVMDDVVIVSPSHTDHDVPPQTECSPPDTTTATTNHHSDNNVPSTTTKKRRRRLGTTSVEEVITPYILQATHGVATHNNNSNTNVTNTSAAGVVYGMAKFHASGREDMNVRMLLPQSYSYDNEKNDTTKDCHIVSPKITGRPFVYEVYDAIRLPRKHDIQNIVSSINHCATTSPSSTSSVMSTNDIRKQRRSYGCNPLGVDISNDISFVPSSSYKRLQEETENKIKYYECYCWCEQSIESIIQSKQRMRQQPPTASPQQNWSNLNINDAEVLLNDLLFSSVTFPLEIQQRTPIRVLHRRTNMIRLRYIHSCRIQLLSNNTDITVALDIKDSTDPVSGSDGTNHTTTTTTTTTPYRPHHFIVHLSTSAGTYVKEFIHGDMGRTVPNLSTLFGTPINNNDTTTNGDGYRADILELDCTGIQS